MLKFLPSVAKHEIDSKHSRTNPIRLMVHCLFLRTRIAKENSVNYNKLLKATELALEHFRFNILTCIRGNVTNNCGF
jgi:hypothetical protein